MKRIVIAEDNALYRRGLVGLLSDFEIAGEAADGNEAVAMVNETRPDLLILDLSMPTMSGLAVIKELRKQHSDLKILVLSIHDADVLVQEAMTAGANGYCLKDEARGTIRSAVEELLEGKTASGCAVG